MKMSMKEQLECDALENELQTLFDETRVGADAHQLNRLARFSSEIPKESSSWLNPFVQQMFATCCLVLGLSALSASAFMDSPRTWSSELVNPEQEINQLLGQESDVYELGWDLEEFSVGFDLLNGTNNIDDELLEDSFQALLAESR